jgi:hypothetical protein
VTGRFGPIRTAGAGGFADLRHDLRRVTAGVATLVRLSRRDDRPESGIGVLSASSPSVRLGGENRYTVGIANARPVARTLVLVLELAPAATEQSSRDRAIVTKALTVPARTAVRLDVLCDWQRSASVTADGRTVPCDGVVPRAGGPLRDQCTVTARLVDLRGRPLDRVTIEQRVAP